MLTLFAFWKSGGLRVSRSLYRLIKQGNAARDARDWKKAAILFRQALEKQPKLPHIWVQYGHASKEAGAYTAASSGYVEALCAGSDDISLLHCLSTIANSISPTDRMKLVALFGSALTGQGASATREVVGETIFDVSDLISYFADARLPTGIQRVQIEVIRSLIEDGLVTRLCCTIEARGDWVEVPADAFLHIVRLAVVSGDRGDTAWIAALNTLRVDLLLADPIRFGREAVLVNLGTSWWLQNYFLQVRNAKERYGIRYVPFVHDLIPIVTPEHCIDRLVRDFVSWTIGVFDHADGFLVASHATERDLRSVAESLGRKMPAAGVGHVPLDADFRPPVDASFDLAFPKGRYVLFVSTIESRKGHISALNAWRILIEQHGAAVPKLVCVGNDGWLNEAFYDRLACDPVLRDRIVLMSGISDAHLAQLYDRCLFTIYPSLYEGWGLPVTESLCHGKVVVTCDNSSLPQAGGGFAVVVETGSATALADAVAMLCFKEGELARYEASILEGFVPRKWATVSADILKFTKHLFAEPARLVHRPVIDLGRWYDLTRNVHDRVWFGIASAEIFRTGDGWAAPDHKGSWILPRGACLLLPVEIAEKSHRLILRLTARLETGFEVFANGHQIGNGLIAEGETQWCAFQLYEEIATEIEVTIVYPGGCGTDAALGLQGFAVCSTDDDRNLLDAIVFGYLDTFTAFNEANLCSKH